MTSPSSSLPPAPPRTSTLAVVSLVCGLLGWSLLPLVGSIAAVVTGHMARAEIRRTPGLDGDGLAVAGLVLGYLAVALAVLAALFFVLVFAGLIALTAVAA